MTDHGSCFLDDLVASFVRHQQRTRGTGAHTLHRLTFDVREFLHTALGDDPIDPARLCASHVIEFISARAARYRPRTVKETATSLRWLFRFLRIEGLHDGQLDKVVPTVANWRLSTIPRGLEERDLARLLESLDGSTACALRDRAIIVLLSSLGLRAGELANLQLEDIDWRAGTVLIRKRKNGRAALLPLNRSAGEAIVAYLQTGRPKTADRHVFVIHGGHVGMAIRGELVAGVVRKAYFRAGIVAPSFGAHSLRHLLASRMVCHGARLDEIANVLGHQSLETTAVYAKVDLPRLREVSLPWPEVRP